MKGKHSQAMIAECFQVLELCRNGCKETVGEVGGREAHGDHAQGGLEEPPRVLPVERLMSDLESLQELTAPATSPRVGLRALGVLLALYVIGDKWILYESGIWGGDWKTESSNFEEAHNLVTRIGIRGGTGTRSVFIHRQLDI